jgi:hypothetical protein
MAPVIALARSEATNAAQFATSARGGARPFRQHGLHGDAGSLRGIGEGLPAVRYAHRLGNRVWPEADDADAGGAELTRENAGERLDGPTGHAVADEPGAAMRDPGVDSVRITPEPCFTMCRATAFAVRKLVRV